MLHKTKGIVLHQFKYTDSSIIAHIYTEKFGRQSYIFNGIRNKKAKGKINYLQALHLLELEVYYKQKSNIQRISEFRPAYIFKSIPVSIVKQTELIFLAEILYKCLKEEEANLNLFDFIYSSIQYFDAIEKGESNFHLLFLIHLTRHLGFFPAKNYNEENRYFDLIEGMYFNRKTGLSERLDESTSRIIYLLSNTSIKELGQFRMNAKERENTLQAILDYYHHHISNMKNLKSLDVLKAVFADN